ncbi:phage major capsid protein [Nocardioides sp. JQ2195]|nr:phage major capsid protein [Nocardioides sp. JQ2195]
MAVDTSTAAELTAEQVQKVLVQPLEAQSAFLAAGPRIIDTAGPLRLPKMGPATSPGWFDENAQITPEVDPTFDEIMLLPSTMQSVKTLTRFSNELARQSVIALDQALRDRIVKDVADTLDKQFLGLAGDGVTKPKGLFVYAGQSLAVDAAVGLDDLLDAEALALGANVNPDALKWVMTSREFIALRKIKAATGSNNYVLQPDPTKSGGYTIFGKPVIVTNHLTDTTGTPNTGNMALVDFSQIVVARDLAPSVKVLDQTFGDYDQQAIRVVARYDVAALNDDAVIELTGITI